MKLATDITHYFERENGPFRSICDLSTSEVKTLMDKERSSDTGFNRYAEGEEFFDFRRAADDALLDLYAKTFHRSPARRPFFAVLGVADVVAGLYRDPYKLSLSVDQFKEGELTFMAPDHFHLVGLMKMESKKQFGWQLPKDYTAQRYPMYGKLFTYRELEARFEEFGVAEHVRRNTESNNWYRYVEAQIWADPKSIAVPEAEWIEAEPEPWTHRGVSYLQNYKKIRTAQMGHA